MFTGIATNYGIIKNINLSYGKNFKNNDLNDLMFDLKSNNNNYELKPSFYNKETNEYCFLLNEFTLSLILKLSFNLFNI